MNIEKEIQEAFEQFHAKDCNCNYEDLKRQLDRQEMLTGHRYLPTSPCHEAWLVFHAGWLASKQHEIQKLEGCVVVPLENARYFSNDGENYEIHETLEQAKHEAECAIEHYSERLADQQMDPTSDGNFHQIGYGVILAESTYSIDHVVTQEDIDNGDFSYEVGTQIMTLSLEEAARGGNE